MNDVFAEFVGVHKQFAGKPVLQGLDLRVEKAESYTLLGGSGTGKSVCLKHMVGLLRPDRGRVVLEGRDVTALRERDWVERRTHVGYVFQGAALFDSLSVKENVAYPLREHRSWDEGRIARRVAECLEAVGLADTEPRLPAELSGGMRKRVGVARAIALEPRAILYDEPTTGLDPANARRIGELIRDLQRRLHVTSVVVTHDLALCWAVADRVGLLEEGRLIVEGGIDEIRHSTLPAVREFLAGSSEDPDGEGRGDNDGA